MARRVAATPVRRYTPLQTVRSDSQSREIVTQPKPTTPETPPQPALPGLPTSPECVGGCGREVTNQGDSCWRCASYGFDRGGG